jgi:hypothetical protein
MFFGYENEHAYEYDSNPLSGWTILQGASKNLTGNR